MTLLDFRKTGSAAYAVSDGLGTLWDQAERLGRVQLEMPIFASDKGKYVAEISFLRPTGTRVVAKGQNDDRDSAMKMAIEEAISLGAEPK